MVKARITMDYPSYTLDELNTLTKDMLIYLINKTKFKRLQKEDTRTDLKKENYIFGAFLMYVKKNEKIDNYLKTKKIIKMKENQLNTKIKQQGFNLTFLELKKEREKYFSIYKDMDDRAEQHIKKYGNEIAFTEAEKKVQKQLPISQGGTLYPPIYPEN